MNKYAYIAFVTLGAWTGALILALMSVLTLEVATAVWSRVVGCAA